MPRRSIKAFAAAAGMLHAVVQGAGAAPCALVKLAEMPITTDGDLLVFDAAVAGNPVRVAIGHGINDAASIQPEFAAALGLKPHDADLPRYAGLVDLPDLLIGKAAISALVAAVPGSSGKPLPPGVQLVIGQEALVGVDLEIDLAHKRLALFKSDHCPGRTVYWTAEWFEMSYFRGRGSAPLVEAKVGDQVVAAEIRLSVASSSVTDRGTWAFAATKLDENWVRLDSLELSGIRLRNLRMGIQRYRLRDFDTGELSKSPARFLGLPDLAIGRDVLAKLRLYVSTEENKIYFTLASDG